MNVLVIHQGVVLRDTVAELLRIYFDRGRDLSAYRGHHEKSFLTGF
jgi:hypothetical protein